MAELVLSQSKHLSKPTVKCVPHPSTCSGLFDMLGFMGFERLADKPQRFLKPLRFYFYPTTLKG